MMMAKYPSSADVELEIYKHLTAIAPGDPSSEHIVMLLDSFEYLGPNGRHQCLVYNPMASTVASMGEKLPGNSRDIYPSSPQRYLMLGQSLYEYADIGTNTL